MHVLTNLKYTIASLYLIRKYPSLLWHGYHRGDLWFPVPFYGSELPLLLKICRCNLILS